MLCLICKCVMRSENILCSQCNDYLPKVIEEGYVGDDFSETVKDWRKEYIVIGPTGVAPSTKSRNMIF